MASSGGTDRRGQRLRSWKEIAAFFGTDERTVRRWEARGLPIHRIPGGQRATVYAEVAELETWLGQRPDEAAGVGGGARRRPLSVLAAAVAVMLVVGASAYLWTRPPSAPENLRAHQPSPKALEAYLAGTYNWERRTPDSLRRAVTLFGQAIAEDPAYADAHAGLANTYLLLREYAGMADAEAYPRARAAADRALALNPELSQAHAARAFVTFYWERDWRRGLFGFEQAIALDPGSARAHHWLATALYHSGDARRALAAINAAQQLEPQSRAILADKGLILFQLGRTGEAVAILGPLAENEPEFLSPHSYLAQIHRARGDAAGWLREARTSARLRGDGDELATLDEAARAFEAGGAQAMLRAMLARQQRLQAAGRESHYAIAVTQALIGDRDATLRHLLASERAREPEILSVRVDPAFRRLRGDPEFQRLAARTGNAHRA
jgi:tetratricopeptide (TPR) repeat protein